MLLFRKEKDSFHETCLVSETGLAFQSGAGMDVSLASKWAVRIQGDFRAVRVSNVTTKQERVVDGIVFKPERGNRFACGRVYRVIAG